MHTNNSSQLANSLLKGSIANAALLLLSFAQSLVLVPFFLKFWGVAQYGVWLSLLSAYAVLQMLDTGFQNFVMNEFNQRYFKDTKEAQRLLGDGFRFLLCLCAIELCVFLILYFINIYICYIPSYLANLFLLFVLEWTLIGNITGFLSRMILPYQQYSRGVWYAIFRDLLRLIILFVAIYQQFSLPLAALFYLGIGVLAQLVTLIDIRKITADVFPWWQQGSVKQGFIYYKKSLTVLYANFVEQFQIQGIPLLLSGFFAPQQIPIYTTLRTLSNLFSQGVSIFTNPLQPILVQHHAQEKKRELAEILDGFLFINNIIIYNILIFLFLYIEKLYQYWLKGNIAFDNSLFQWLLLGMMFTLFGKILTMYLNGINNRQFMHTTATARLLSFFVTLFLCFPSLGLVSVGIAVAFSELISSVFLPLYFLKKSSPPLPILWKNQFIGLLPCLIFSIFMLTKNHFLLPEVILLFITFLALNGAILWHWKNLTAHNKSHIKNILFHNN